jgi:hypothetical protein
MERLLEYAGNLPHLLDQIAVFGERFRRTGRIDLLKNVPAEQTGLDLPGDHDQRDRIHVSGRNRGEQIGGARTRSRDADRRPAGDPRIAGCGMSGVLFRPHKDMLDSRAAKGVIKRADRCPRIAEYGGNALLFERFHHRLCACDHPSSS